MWFILSLFSACSETAKNIHFSREDLRKLPPTLKAIAVSACALPILLIILAWNGLPVVQPAFWFIIAIHGVLLATAHVLYMTGLAKGPLSQTQPILSLQIPLLLITNPLMTSDRMSVIGIVGALLTAVGVYATQLGNDEHAVRRWDQFTAPFKEILKPGMREMLGVTCIYAITSNLDKLAMQTSSGPFFLVIDQFVILTLLGTIYAIGKRRSAGHSQGDIQRLPYKLLLAGGTINGVTITAQVGAYALAPVPFVIAIKQLSTVFAGFWGMFVRKDRKPYWYRLFGMIIAVAGAMIILLAT
jgi:drug/metabolite transporter (DMT)-like permease